MTNEINLYSKEQTDALLDEKEDAGTSYTKAEADALLDEKEDVGIAYTKAETDALLDEKEDVGLSYTKAQVDGLLADKATYGEVVELGGSSDIGSDLRPIKIVGDTAVAVTNPLIDTETEQTINAKKTFAVNAKSAAPASGAVDTSVVNANWVSQTGDDAPNDLVHRHGNETKDGIFTLNKGYIGFPALWHTANADNQAQGQYAIFAKMPTNNIGLLHVIDFIQASNTAVAYGRLILKEATNPLPIWVWRKSNGGNNPLSSEAIHVLIKDNYIYLAWKKEPPFGLLNANEVLTINYGAPLALSGSTITWYNRGDAIILNDLTGYTDITVVE